MERLQEDALERLGRELSAAANRLSGPGAWPREQLAACAEVGVFEWFVPQEWGGQGWDDVDLITAYLRMSQACLTTTFVLTQLTGALRRIVAGDGEVLRQQLLPCLLRGEALATVGISHLTTSRQHLQKPVLMAEFGMDGESSVRLDGISPWVTGAAQVDYVLTGAALADGRQLLAIVPTDAPGVFVEPPAELTALSASQTGAVRFENVLVDRDSIVAGPVEHVMRHGAGATTGGLQTSTLALGLARAAVEFVQAEAEQRAELRAAADQLDAEWQASRELLLALAHGACDAEAAGRLRAQSNSLVLRATQAGLVAAKGAGYVAGHPAGRWCRESLFFLVWSCPQPVAAANLCEFAGIQT